VENFLELALMRMVTGLLNRILIQIELGAERGRIGLGKRLIREAGLEPCEGDSGRKMMVSGG